MGAKVKKERPRVQANCKSSGLHVVQDTVGMLLVQAMLDLHIAWSLWPLFSLRAPGGSRGFRPRSRRSRIIVDAAVRFHIDPCRNITLSSKSHLCDNCSW